jgi:sphingomyelin phosphodiesterase acid-like 3
MHASSAQIRILTSVLLCIATRAVCAPPQKHAAAARTVNVVMLSDLHFDPFHDPTKVAELRREPVSEWAAILNAPAAASQAADFSALQGSCQIRGVDSPWSLVRLSLQQAKLREPKPLFVTVSGDLLAHGFPCKFHALMHGATAEDLSAFSAKTIAFLVLQLRRTFPATPVYFALGNNDSGCGDYQETSNSMFLRSVGTSFAEDLSDPANRASLLSTFSRFGDYSVMLPAPMQSTRLIVLQDIFESAHFEGCSGGPEAGAAADQMDWLRAQLAETRAKGKQVWVMAHIPPGIDVYASFHRYLFAPGEACSVRQPQTFLKGAALGDTIAEFSDVVRLAIFAHTHMDEIKLLGNGQGDGVPVKLVPSISPINGNDPAFLVAQVAPQTATLKDYTAYAAANAQGTGWAREYRYSETYGLPDFSAASVRQLTSDFIADRTGENETSRRYERYFLAGGGTFATLGLQRLWPAYSCSLREWGPEAFHRCMCPPDAAKP